MSEPIAAIIFVLFAYLAIWLVMRRYFVELIAIIVLGLVLIALLLPAVQAARVNFRQPRQEVQ